jgi:hypothetical protein
MVEVIYKVVEHDGGWAYQVGATYSETFPDRDTALAAARRAAAEQHVAGETRGISWEDTSGNWHSEVADGGDRPDAKVED